ncbi:enoyl-CoA hydratase/isomerase family protein [Rhodoferax aquaticus]|uniref:Enoyl-CoA hydratase/isomerase family protein n=1 Tax=Rhodoferax aquaticus TaxID=2527691 RepID=A0A515EP21_9BURK|nr:enoyl-CoA hydratase/isomerase family protein [Rhodoferax aquaticus]QDL54403.1 enoyl-CoA hydratase/isomerase family protein [Rhodoferax aquaticus]
MTYVHENSELLTEVRGGVGFITLNRPKALNALSLGMVRSLSAVLLDWKDTAAIHAVAIRGSNKEGVFGGFCAGGDIRFFHAAALAGNPALEDFFTEEYALNHLIHTYPKPYIAFMDGIVMGGGMGISQGASHRLVTARTKMAMPETNIGLFPDVGGGYFLSRCPGRVGEWLALTGEVIGADQALAFGLADHVLDPANLATAWDALASQDWNQEDPLVNWVATYSVAESAHSTGAEGQIDQFFSRDTVSEILSALELDASGWAQATAATLRKRSPLMLHIVLEQVRRARSMTLADDLRMERGMVRHCFATQHLGRQGPSSETVEGIRALAVDKDHSPRWSPARIEDVTTEMVEGFFQSPWPAHAHPLRDLV